MNIFSFVYLFFLVGGSISVAEGEAPTCLNAINDYFLCHNPGVDQINKFIEIESSITLNKLAGNYLEKVDPKHSERSFSDLIRTKIKERRRELKAAAKEDPEFDRAASAFLKAPVSRRALSEVTPHLRALLNQQVKDSEFQIDDNDLKMIDFVAQAEKKNNNYQGRMTAGTKGDSAIINYATLINSAYVNSGERNTSADALQKNLKLVKQDRERLEKKLRNMKIVPEDICEDPSEVYSATLDAIMGLAQGPPTFCKKNRDLFLRTTAEDCSCARLHTSYGKLTQVVPAKGGATCQFELGPSQKQSRSCPPPTRLMVAKVDEHKSRFYCFDGNPRAGNSNCKFQLISLLDEVQEQPNLDPASGKALCYGVPSEYRAQNSYSAATNSNKGEDGLKKLVGGCAGETADGVVDGAIGFNFGMKDLVSDGVQGMMGGPKKSVDQQIQELNNLEGNMSFTQRLAVGVLKRKIQAGTASTSKMTQEEVKRKLQQTAQQSNSFFDKVKNRVNEIAPGLLDGACWKKDKNSATELCSLTGKVLGGVGRDALLCAGVGAAITAATGGGAAPVATLACEEAIGASVSTHVEKATAKFVASSGMTWAQEATKMGISHLLLSSNPNLKREEVMGAVDGIADSMTSVGNLGRDMKGLKESVKKIRLLTALTRKGGASAVELKRELIGAWKKVKAVLNPSAWEEVKKFVPKEILDQVNAGSSPVKT